MMADEADTLTDGQRHELAMVDMANAVPDGGATIIVLRNDLGRIALNYVRRHRGEALSHLCRTVTIWRRGDPANIEGLSGPVIFDWLWERHVKPSVKAQAEGLLSHPLVTIVRPDYGAAERNAQSDMAAPHASIVDWLECSVRAVTVLRKAGVRTAFDLAALTERDLKRVEGCGKHTAAEIMAQRRAVLTSPDSIRWMQEDGIVGPLSLPACQ